MLSKFLVTRFVKDYKSINNNIVRESYGYLGGIVGIIVNTALFLVKLAVGLVVESIAITADAFNNLSDALSSIITMVGFKLASKPADKEHPFGHGRLEYISGLIVAFMVMLVGFEFIKSSFSRIINPVNVSFQLIPFVFILISIGAKIWLSRFNKYIGDAINSSALKASSLDALGDVITSGTAALSLLLSKWTPFPIDGYIGILVSLFILYSGYSLIKETINPILGEAPDPEFIEALKKDILSYHCISGVHDIIVHNYGPGMRMASLHVEVPCNISIVKIHDIIDRLERELSKKYNIFLVVHMDPVNTDSKEVNMAKLELEKVLSSFKEVKSYDDFRVIGEGEYKNLIFNVMPSYKIKTENEEEELKLKIDEKLKESHPHYNAMINIKNKIL